MSNYILIKTDHQNKLEHALYDLANLYSSSEDTKRIQLYRKKGLSTDFLIKFSNQPDFIGFSYYVNYLDYPFDNDHYQFTVRGYYKTSNIDEFPILKQRKWLLIYVNPKDDAGDNVYILDENNKSFIYDFGGKIKQIKESQLSYKFTEVYKEDYHHITDINPMPKDMADKKYWWKFW